MGKGKILIVDVPEESRKALSECLDAQYECFPTETPAHAIELFKNNPFDIVITEVDTLGMKGVEVIRKFKELQSDVTMIAISNYNSVPLAVEAMKQGAYNYVTKPFNLDELKIVVQNAIERQKLIEEVKEKQIYQELALLDGLTKIYNRRYFDEMLRQETDRASRYPQKFSLLMMDIDDFKQFNDRYGHFVGDNILKEIAQIIYYRTRSIDFAARYGGEEFALIAPHTEKKSASILATRILNFISQKDFVLDSSTVLKATVSIGVATFGDDAFTKEELIQTADKALYQAKMLGKNKVCLFGLDTNI